MNSRSHRLNFDWLQDPKIRSVAITGICKNAGKTTLLNYLLARENDAPRGVFSTGIDGEETDTVFRNPKPRVKLPAGCLFCCDTTTLDGHAGSLSVLAKLPYGDPLRPLWIAQAEETLETEITGPAAVSDQIRTLALLRQFGAASVLIDGSLDRKSIALSMEIDAVIVLLGASFGPPASVAEELRRLQLLNSLPTPDPALQDTVRQTLLDSEHIHLLQQSRWQDTRLSSLIGTDRALKELLAEDTEALYIPGALTDALLPRFRALLATPLRIILRHPDCLKLPAAKLEPFLREFHPAALTPFKIKSFVLNSLAIGAPAVEATVFRARVRAAFPDLNLPDIKELTL